MGEATSTHRNDDLLRRGVCRVGTRRPGLRWRWVAVRDLLGVGSTTATILCRWAGVDPDEKVGTALPAEGDTCDVCGMEVADG